MFEFHQEYISIDVAFQARILFQKNIFLSFDETGRAWKSATSGGRFESRRSGYSTHGLCNFWTIAGTAADIFDTILHLGLSRNLGWIQTASGRCRGGRQALKEKSRTRLVDVGGFVTLTHIGWSPSRLIIRIRLNRHSVIAVVVVPRRRSHQRCSWHTRSRSRPSFRQSLSGCRRPSWIYGWKILQRKRNEINQVPVSDGENFVWEDTNQTNKKRCKLRRTFEFIGLAGTAREGRPEVLVGLWGRMPKVVWRDWAFEN